MRIRHVLSTTIALLLDRPVIEEMRNLFLFEAVNSERCTNLSAKLFELFEKIVIWIEEIIGNLRQNCLNRVLHFL